MHKGGSRAKKREQNAIWSLDIFSVHAFKSGFISQASCNV